MGSMYERTYGRTRTKIHTHPPTHAPVPVCTRRGVRRSGVCLIALLCAFSVGAAGTMSDLEALAWHFRFTHGAAHSSVLLPPLQRTLHRMQEHVAANLGQAWGEVKEGQLGLCIDECGAVEVGLGLWVHFHFLVQKKTHHTHGRHGCG